MARYAWRSIDTAPRNGTPVKIRGRRFITDTLYREVAIWTTRNCPAPTEGWFPPQPDGEGPYLDVTDWLPLH
jgi:hypothetical protein